MSPVRAAVRRFRSSAAYLGTPCRDPTCPGELLPLQGFSWSSLCGQRLLPQMSHRNMRAASIGKGIPKTSTVVSYAWAHRRQPQGAAGVSLRFMSLSWLMQPSFCRLVGSTYPARPVGCRPSSWPRTHLRVPGSPVPRPGRACRAGRPSACSGACHHHPARPVPWDEGSPANPGVCGHKTGRQAEAVSAWSSSQWAGAQDTTVAGSILVV